RLFGMLPATRENTKADPRNDCCQPAAEVLDHSRVRPAQANPGLLHRVVGLGERPEHPVGDSAEVPAVLLEALRQPRALADCHISSSNPVIEMTAETREM